MPADFDGASQFRVSRPWSAAVRNVRLSGNTGRRLCGSHALLAGIHMPVGDGGNAQMAFGSSRPPVAFLVAKAW